MSLENVTFESENTAINESAFSGCKNLVNINLPSKIQKISKETFSGCSSLPNIDIPATVNTIEESAFYGCTNFTNMTITSKNIESNAFAGCSSLKTVTITEGVDTLKDNIFSGCNNLTTIHIPASVTSIGSNAFDDLDSLVSIEVEFKNEHFGSDNGVLYRIDDYSLIRFPPGKAGNLNIAERTKIVNGDAFQGCKRLININVPSSVERIDLEAFDGLVQLANINVAEGNSVYSSKNGVLYNKNGDELLRYPEGKKGGYDIPAGTKNIRNEAFKGCTQLTSVKIPSDVKSIGIRSFYNCSGLVEVAIPKEVNKIGSSAFEGCTSLSKVTIAVSTSVRDTSLTAIPSAMLKGCSELESVSIPNNILSIEREAFSGCSKLSTIKLPDNLQKIEAKAFYESGLTTVTIPATVNEISDDSFNGCKSLSEIKVDENNQVYKSDNGVLYNNLTDEVVQLPKAWSGEYIIPQTVTSIDNVMFYGCHKLTGVSIPWSVSSIADGAFVGCSSLKSFTVDEMNMYFKTDDKGVLFSYDMKALKQYPEGRSGSYVIPAGTEEIDEYAFYANSGLTGVTISSSVKMVGGAAFAKCDNLKDVVIESGVTTLGDSVFANCTSLESLTIPSSVVSIGFSAFKGCSNLVSVTYEGNLNPCTDSDVADVAFEGCDSMSYVCLSSKYTDKQFCNRTDFCLSDSCKDFHLYSDHCSHEVCKSGEKVMEDRANATEWVKRSNGCVDCQCNKTTGRVQYSRCKGSAGEGKSFMCVNDGCLIRDQVYSIEIEFASIIAIDVNTSELKVEIEALTGVEVTNVGLEINEQAYVIHVVVIVEDEASGNTIVDAVNKMEKGEECQYKTLCNSGAARLIVVGDESEHPASEKPQPAHSSSKPSPVHSHSSSSSDKTASFFYTDSQNKSLTPTSVALIVVGAVLAGAALIVVGVFVAKSLTNRGGNAKAHPKTVLETIEIGDIELDGPSYESQTM